MQTEEITSTQNPKIKQIVALMEKARERHSSNLFVVEGVREVTACLCNNYIAEALYFAPEIAGAEMERLPQLAATLQKLPYRPKVFSLSNAAYAKVAYREGTEGVLAVVRQRNLTLQELSQALYGTSAAESSAKSALTAEGRAPLILVCEGIEKPGNIGAMLRTADACGTDALILCNSRCDLFNPNLIRASLGSLFTQRVISCTSREAGEWLLERGFQILTAQLQDSSYYYNIDMTLPTAIVMGSEAEGLTNYWREISTAKIKIPMLGQMDSLNVSVSAAVLCYEALRQRQNGESRK